MAFCTKCGAEIGENENFCKNCGNKIGGDTNKVIVSSKIGNYFNEILQAVKKIILHPVTAIGYAKSELGNEASIIMAGIMAVLFSLLNMWFIKILISSFENAIRSLISSISGNSILSYFTGSSSYNIDYDIPYLRIFLTSIIAFVSFMVVVWFLIYVSSKFIFKSSVKLNDVWKIIVLSMLPFVIVFFVSVISAYLSLKLCVGLIIFGSLISMFTFYKGLSIELSDISQDIVVVMVSLVVIIAYLSASVTLASLFKALSYGIGNSSSFKGNI